MNRKVVIIVSLVLAVIFTFVVVRSANVKYASLKETVEIVKTTQHIPAYSKIRIDQVTTVKLPETITQQGEFVKNIDDIVGKTTKVSLLEDQLVMQDTVSEIPLAQGMLEIHVPVDISSSAAVVAGDVVDIFAVDKNQGASAVKIYHAATVIHSYDQGGNEISPVSSKASGVAPPGTSTPVSVGLKVSEESASVVVTAASKKMIYLAKIQPG